MRIMSRKANAFVSGTAILMVFASGALAHPGHAVQELSGNLFLAGMLHPLTGFDHLLAMLAVGLWSALTHTSLRQAILTPVCFLVLLLIGALMGLAGIHLPGVEPMIMASLLVLGLLVASRQSMPTWLGFAMVGFFALFHGLAHAMELPHGGGAMLYVAGFMATTFVLQVLGLFAGFQLKRYSTWISGALGAGIAAYGAMLFVGI